MVFSLKACKVGTRRKSKVGMTRPTSVPLHLVHQQTELLPFISYVANGED